MILYFDLLLLRIVTGKCNKSSKGEWQGEEDLSGCVQPHLGFLQCIPLQREHTSRMGCTVFQSNRVLGPIWPIGISVYSVSYIRSEEVHQAVSGPRKSHGSYQEDCQYEVWECSGHIHGLIERYKTHTERFFWKHLEIFLDVSVTSGSHVEWVAQYYISC